MNTISSYPYVNGYVPDSSQYLKDKKTSEIYLGENKKKSKNKNKKKYYNNSSQNNLNYQIGKAYVLNYPASAKNIYFLQNSLILYGKNN